MSNKRIKAASFILTIIFLLCSATNVLAIPIYSDPQSPIGDFSIIGDHLKMIDPNTGTFQYKFVDMNGTDITQKIPSSDIKVDAEVVTNRTESSYATVKAVSSIEPQTGTCILKYNFTESEQMVYVDFDISFGAKYSQGFRKILYIGDDKTPEVRTQVDQIQFVSDSLTKTGSQTATFKYKITGYIGSDFDGFYGDITQKIPASQIEAFSSLDSNIILDPSTGTGTNTFNTSDTNVLFKTTLRDKLTGVTAVLNTYGLDPVPANITTPSAISRINFVSSDLTKTGADTATFQYKILDQHYSDVTKTIPAKDLDATALIGSSKADINLDPATGMGTITYHFADKDQQVMISLMHKKGMGVSSLLNLNHSESDNAADSTTNDLKIAQISFVPTDMLTFNSCAELKYLILNKEGKDITRKIAASQLNVSSSVNSMIALKPSDGAYIITYNLYNSEKTIIVTIEDKETGIKTALNIGKMPTDSEMDKDKDSNTSENKIIEFKDPILEQAIRKLIYKPTANIDINDVKEIPDLYIDKGCTDLSGIENLKGLVSLDISSDQIKDLSPLKEIPKLRNLVYRGSINDLKSLEDLKNLKLLDLGYTQINDNDLSMLKKNLPDCFILH
ncbi:hypothetical protein ACHOLT_06330 [Desulfitobacterium sp. Sab5]|uniref:hypothetical protein n=1 Tax=Desulfitobacterium nosdiversum TaxID=3375356 RepID=UPI003CFA2045